MLVNRIEQVGFIQKTTIISLMFVFLAFCNICEGMDSTRNLMMLDNPHRQYKQKKKYIPLLTGPGLKPEPLSPAEI